MSNNTKRFLKVFYIFISSIILAWPARIIFADLYIKTLKPVQYPSTFLPWPTGHHLEGYFIAYVFFTTLFTFLSIEKDIQRWVLAILVGPLLALMLLIGAWGMFPWFSVAFVFSFALAKLAHFAIKKFKTT